MIKKKKYFICIAILILIFFTIISYKNAVYAETDSFFANLEEFRPTDIDQGTAFKNKVGKVLGGISVAGTAVSVISLILMGFNYMIGSVEDKANYKKVMMPWLIGAILVFTATTLPNLLYSLGETLNQSTQQQEEQEEDDVVIKMKNKQEQEIHQIEGL